jgi:hypothetical protein
MDCTRYRVIAMFLESRVEIRLQHDTLRAERDHEIGNTRIFFGVRRGAILRTVRLAVTTDTFFSVLVPPPKQLTLERQLNKSILIGWNTPDCPPGTIDCYHVYVNGVLKTTVKASERTRALVEGVDSNRVSDQAKNYIWIFFYSFPGHYDLNYSKTSLIGSSLISKPRW